jgi:hypothetical protein
MGLGLFALPQAIIPLLLGGRVQGLRNSKTITARWQCCPRWAKESCLQELCFHPSCLKKIRKRQTVQQLWLRCWDFVGFFVFFFNLKKYTTVLEEFLLWLSILYDSEI